jgi:hypothetical protein
MPFKTKSKGKAEGLTGQTSGLPVNELYSYLTKFWHEHSMVLSVKQKGFELPQNFYNNVVPISENIQQTYAVIKCKIKNGI